jgi:hypothetical protein
MFHPDSSLRFHSAQLHLCYDGSIRLSVNAEVIAPDGRSTELRHGYTHRISPHHPHWRYLAEALRPAVRAHHEALGLACPDEGLPIHLHPQGHPAFGPPPLGEPEPVDQDALRTAIVRAKEAELGAAIPPHAYPTLEGPGPEDGQQEQ